MTLYSYSLIGLSCVIFTDLVLSTWKKNPLAQEASNDWDLFARILLFCFWPIAIIMFLFGLIQTFKK
tara:strand:+ start:2038 stop:2238 length:201 start_codon:yes stop_codon:yes gene_type:complete